MGCTDRLHEAVMPEEERNISFRNPLIVLLSFNCNVLTVIAFFVFREAALGAKHSIEIRQQSAISKAVIANREVERHWRPH